MNSYTSFRTYITLPDALTLNQAALDAACTGILAANVRWVRIVLPWSTIQPTAPTVTTTTTKVGTKTVITTTSTPTFTWTAADLAVNRALAAGLNVQVVLAPPKPSWATGAITPTTFTPFAQAVANRYKPGGAGITVTGRFVTEYQVWHEPNVVANWPATVSAAAYVAVLKAAYAAIKASHSGAVVVAAGLQACLSASTPARPGVAAVVSAQEPVAYLTAMYTAGAKGYLDVAAYHPLTLPTAQFPDPAAPSGLTMKQADAFWAALKARDAGRKVYWSQVGFVSGAVNGTGVISNEQQAAYLDTMRWFAEERKDWVSGLALASWRDA